MVDGVTEALATSGIGGDSLSNNNDAVTKWHSLLPKRIATTTGAAVLQVDHVTKAKDNRGGYAIGGQAKRAAITGAAYVVQARQAFGRGRPGSFDLYVAKDRLGYVLGALAGEATAAGRLACRVRVEAFPDRDDVDLHLVPPEQRTDDGVHEAMKGRICSFLATLPLGHQGASTNTIKREVSGHDSAKTEALAQLVASGRVLRTMRGQSALHSLADQDEADELGDE